jgi:hypothetical protein
MANTAIARIMAQPALDDIARPLSEAVVAAYRHGGKVGGAVKDAVHGVWLGHPLHPVLTDVPLGAWTTTLALDATAAVTGDEAYERGADVALAVGLVGAIGAAVTGQRNRWTRAAHWSCSRLDERDGDRVLRRRISAAPP